MLLAFTSLRCNIQTVAERVRIGQSFCTSSAEMGPSECGVAASPQPRDDVPTLLLGPTHLGKTASDTFVFNSAGLHSECN
jgi:hypothetical protein